MGAITSTLLTGAQAYGTAMQGVAASKAEEYNAAVSRANAQAVQSSADLDIARQKKAAKRILSAQRAGYAKAGVKLEGSPLEVMLDSASEAELDMLITEFNAKMQKTKLEAQANQYEKAAKVALRKGYIGGATTLLSSFASSGAFQQKPQYANYGGQRVQVAPKDYYKSSAAQARR